MAIKHRKFKLSPKREKWVQGRDTTLRGEPVRLNPRTAERYAEEVEKMVRKMHLDVSGQVERLFASPTAKNSIQPVEQSEELKESGAAMDASISSQSRILINKLIDKWTKRFNRFGKDWTNSMIGHVEAQSAKDLSRSLDKLSGGLTIDTNTMSRRTKDIVAASADQSTSLIKSIGSDYTTDVKEAVMRSITDDTQSFTALKDSIHSMLQDKYKRYRNKGKNVALDQTRKAYSNITASRMKDAGVDTYQWLHTGGSADPRNYHKYVLNGNVYSLSDPPVVNPKTGEKGKPGSEINCKCAMLPVISFENKNS